MLLSNSRLLYDRHLNSVYSVFFNCKCKKNPSVCHHGKQNHAIWLNLLRLLGWYLRGLAPDSPTLRSMLHYINLLSLFLDNFSFLLSFFFTISYPAAFKKYKPFYFFFLHTLVFAISTWVQTLLLPVIACWAWAHYGISLRLSLFICIMGIIVLTSEFCLKD